MASKRAGKRSKYANDAQVKRAIEDIANCYVRFEEISCQLRRNVGQAERERAYHDAYVEWQEPDKPNLFPCDEHQQEEYFRKCQALLPSNPATTKDCVLVGFACHAKRVGLTEQLKSHPAHEYIMVQSHLLALERLRVLHARENAPSLPTSPDPPVHVANAISPADVEGIPIPNAMEKVGPFLVGKSFEYYDVRTGRSTTCLVHDCGTSHKMGAWFSVSYGEQAQTMISKSEMMDLWEARETEPELSEDDV